MRRSKSDEVRRMVAKFPGRCSVCNGAIRPGEEIVWSPRTRAAHVACEAEVKPRRTNHELAMEAFRRHRERERDYAAAPSRPR